MLQSKPSHMQLSGSNGSECGCKGEESTLLGLCVGERAPSWRGDLPFLLPGEAGTLRCVVLTEAREKDRNAIEYRINTISIHTICCLDVQDYQLPAGISGRAGSSQGWTEQQRPHLHPLPQPPLTSCRRNCFCSPPPSSCTHRKQRDQTRWNCRSCRYFTVATDAAPFWAFYPTPGFR